MKKGHLTIYSLLCAAICIGVVACTLPGKDKDYNLQETFLSEETAQEINYAERVASQREKCMVQVETLHYLGSGVIYDMNETEMWIVTAAHIMEKSENLSIVTLSDGYTVTSKECHVAEDADLAFLKIEYQDEMSQNREELIINHLDSCVAVEKKPEIQTNLEVGSKVVALGSAKGVAKNAYEGKVQSAYIYVDDFSQHMVIADVYATAGMSGGALFTEQGEFLGVIAGIHDENQKCETAVIPLTTVISKEYLMKE